jgi:uncharacterized protein (UPF0276 family)
LAIVNTPQISFALRPQHISSWRKQPALPPHLEVLVDNVLFHKGGAALGHLDWFAQRTSLLFHSVGLNLGGQDPLSAAYLGALVELERRYEPLLLSDHLCFTKAGGHSSYDLLPLPLNPIVLDHVASRVHQVQDTLGRTLAIENVSRYIDYRSSTLTEFAFLDELCRRTECRVLLDVNNLYVNALNFGFDPVAEMRKLRPECVAQYHVAGHSRVDDFLHDTHDQPVKDDVWHLVCCAIPFFGLHPIVLEHDDDDAPLQVLFEQAKRGLHALGQAPSQGHGTTFEAHHAE